MGSRQGLTTGPFAGVVSAVGVYGLWAFVLFSPHAQSLSSSFRLLYAIHPTVAATGIFLLSRRWVSGWTASVLIGLFYGFGPFGLSFIGFHPLTGLTFAAVPWLLLPAVYWHRSYQPSFIRFAIRALFCLLPIAFIIAFFWTFSQHWAIRTFLLPKKTMLSGYDFLGLLLPLSMTGRPVVLGVYHFGLPALLMGVFVYVSSQRIAVLILPAVGLVLAFLNPVFGVSPIIWAAIPMVFLAVLLGVGIQSLLWAGKNESKWVFFCTLATLAMAATALVLYLPYRAVEYQNPAIFYLVSSMVLGMILLLSRVGLRWLFVRWFLITAAAAADCYLSGRWLVDRLL